MIPLEFLGLGVYVAACYQLRGGQTCDTILGLLLLACETIGDTGYDSGKQSAIGSDSMR